MIWEVFLSLLDHTYEQKMPFGRWPSVTSWDFLNTFNVFILFWLDCTFPIFPPQTVGINLGCARSSAVSAINYMVDQPRIAFPYFFRMLASKSSRKKWTHATGMTGATGVTWAGKSHVLASKKCKHYLCRGTLTKPEPSVFSKLQFVQQPQPLHRESVWLSSDPMAQPFRGTDICGHSHPVLQGLSHRGTERPAASHRLRSGNNSNMSDPCHGQPRGTQDQEWRRQLLKTRLLPFQASRRLRF